MRNGINVLLKQSAMQIWIEGKYVNQAKNQQKEMLDQLANQNFLKPNVSKILQTKTVHNFKMWRNIILC